MDSYCYSLIGACVCVCVWSAIENNEINLNRIITRMCEVFVFVCMFMLSDWWILSFNLKLRLRIRLQTDMMLYTHWINQKYEHQMKKKEGERRLKKKLPKNEREKKKIRKYRQRIVKTHQRMCWTLQRMSTYYTTHSIFTMYNFNL